nr:RNA helicase Mov10l1-like isoform X2 [Procambarus clarkii]
MITLVQKAFGYFVGGRDDQPSKWEEVDRPRLEDFVSVSPSTVETCDFEGVITSVRGSDIIINNDIYCDASKFQAGEKICVNNQVTGVAERRNKHEAWRAVHVQMLQERWDDDGGGGDEAQLNSCKNDANDRDVFPGKCTKTSLDPEMRIPHSVKQYVHYPAKTRQFETQSTKDPKEKVIGRVTGMCGGTVSLNENISFSLSETNCNWKIVKGDWVICEVDNSSTARGGDRAKMEGIVQVVSCKPLRRKRVRGEVTHCYPTFCIINQEIYCTRAVAEAASVKAGDTVMVEAIESHQRNFCWRALEVNSDLWSAGIQELGTSRLTRHLLDFPNCALSTRENKTEKMLENKNNIVITESLRFPTLVLGAKSYISVSIKNNGSVSKTLKRIYFVTATQECQFNVVHCSAGGIVDGTPVTIDRDVVVDIRFECTGKLLGMARQLCIFDFGDFQIGRYASANVEDHNMMCLAPVAPYVPKQKFKNSLHFQSKDREIIRGEKPFKSAAFLSVSLPMAHVPKQLWQAIRSNVDILSVAPSLSDPLTSENHKEKLSALLHLEEIEMTLQIRQFDMARTNFSVHGEYLSLVVPGLSEKRPSLMIGDTVIASSPCDSNELEYEGYIHEVLHTQVLLKFHPTFHSDYRGEDYAVRFNFSRTPLRRCHFALEFAMKQLGPNILFPSKLQLQPPQVCYIDPEAPTLAYRARKAPDITAVNHNLITQISQSENINIGSDTEVQVKQRPEAICSSVEEKYCTNEYVAENKAFTGKLLMELKHNTSQNKIGVEIENLKNEATVRRTCKESKEFDDNSRTLVEKKINVEIGSDDLRLAVQSQRKNSSPVTPRIPVVTRLFGVSSSGSSSNSSMCCSDDESRNSTSVGFKNDAFHAKKLTKKKLNFGSISITEDIEIGSKSGSGRKACINNVNSNTPEAAARSSVEEVTDFRTWQRSSVSKAAPLPKQCEKKGLAVHKVKTTKRIPLRAEGGNVPLFLPRSLELSFYKRANRTKEGRVCGENQTCTITRDIKFLETDHRKASERSDSVVDNVCCETGASRVDSESGKASVSRVDSEACETGAGRVDSESGKAGVSRVDSEACETGAGRVDSESGKAGVSRVDSEACETGAGRVDSESGKAGVSRVDSEACETGAGRVDSEACETGAGRVDSEACETDAGHVDSECCRHDALLQEPFPNNFTKIKSTDSCQRKKNRKENIKSKNYSTKSQKWPTNQNSAGARSDYIVPVLPIFTRKKGTKSLAHVPVLKWFNKSLNAEQKVAVCRVLEGSTRPLPYVIFGPPGTGKTVTLVETALQIFTMIEHSRIIIITPSNSASDLVMERLVASGQLGKMEVVRLNAYQRLEDAIPEVIRPYCCNGDELSVRAHQRIIVTTATTAGVMYTLGLHNGHFSHVLVDEAGQLTEPECLVGLGLVNSTSGQLVLVGDPEQLGPVVQSGLAKRYGLQHSLLQRLCYSVLYQPEEVSKSSAWLYQACLVTQLVKNYRSHPDILHVPSTLFYHSSLQACADNKVNEELLAWDELPCPSCPLLFHGVVGDNLQEGDSPSWFNAAEAFQVVRYTKSLIMFGVKPQDVGIITPYRKQVEKVRKLLITFGIEENVKVGSVEEFQGQERRVIIISTVRSSTELVEVDVRHSLGFVKCPKRFNVAVTRAQGLLLVVGNPLLLVQDNCWCQLIKFCLQKGAYRGPELDHLVRDDYV